MKKLLPVFFMALLTLSACSLTIPEEDTTTEEATDSATEETEELVPPTDDTLTYTNFDHKFMLTIPLSWDGFTTVKKLNDLTEGVEERIVFRLDGEDIFNINVYKTEDYNAILESADGPIPGAIGSNDTHTFTWWPNQGVVSEKAQAAMKDVDGIVNSFRDDPEITRNPTMITNPSSEVLNAAPAVVEDEEL